MKTNVTTLPNGLRVISVENPSLNTANVSVWIYTGSENETKENNGISHFLEHMVFKGTQKRSKEKIVEDLHYVGGTINAGTGIEFTHFSTSILKDNLEIAVDVLSDLLQHPVFDEKEILLEKKVVCQELRGISGDHVDKKLNNIIFGTEEHQLRIGGLIKNVKQFTRQDLIDYMSKHYTAPNMAVCACGNVNHEELVELVKKYFTDLSSAPVEKRSKRNYVGGYLYADSYDRDAQVKLAFDAKDVKDSAAKHFLGVILGGDMGSRLFKVIRAKRGMTYGVTASVEHFLDGDLFVVKADCEIKNFNKVVTFICEEIIDICFDGITDEELELTRKKLIADYTFSLDDMETCMVYYATSYLKHDKVISLEEMIEKIKDVSANEVRKVARLIFSSPITYYVLGNMKGFATYGSIVKTFQNVFDDIIKNEGKL